MTNEHTSCHGAIACRLSFRGHGLQQPTWTGAHWLSCVRVQKANQEERDIVLPGNAPKAAEVRDCDEVAITVFLVADGELLVVGHVMLVPTKDHGAEAKALGNDGQKLALLHELAPQLAIDINTGHLDHAIILQDLGHIRGGDVGDRHCVNCVKQTRAFRFKGREFWGS